jgi:hypothetical protein
MKLIVNNEISLYKIVTLYITHAQGKQYLILGKYCLSMPVNGTFKKIEIPSSAQKVGEGRIGTAGYGVDFKRYSGVVRSGDKIGNHSESKRSICTLYTPIYTLYTPIYTLYTPIYTLYTPIYI